MITVDLGGTTKMIRREDVTYVQAQGDYARLHTAEASYLIRVPLADLEQQWADAGFIRIHRSYLIALSHVSHLKLAAAGPASPWPGPNCPSAAGTCRRSGRSSRQPASGRRHDAGPGHGAPQRHARQRPPAARRQAARGTRAARHRGAAARRPSARPTAAEESDAGQLFVRSLIRSQLRLGLVVAAGIPADPARLPADAGAGPGPGGLHDCRPARSTGCCWASGSTR